MIVVICGVTMRAPEVFYGFDGEKHAKLWLRTEHVQSDGTCANALSADQHAISTAREAADVG